MKNRFNRGIIFVPIAIVFAVVGSVSVFYITTNAINIKAENNKTNIENIKEKLDDIDEKLDDLVNALIKK